MWVKPNLKAGHKMLSAISFYDYPGLDADGDDKLKGSVLIWLLNNNNNNDNTLVAGPLQGRRTHPSSICNHASPAERVLSGVVVGDVCSAVGWNLQPCVFVNSKRVCSNKEC